MDFNSDQPPGHLSENAQAIWRAVIDQAESPGRRVFLLQALEAWDRADQARRQIGSEGLTTTTKSTGVVHVHPLVKVERDNRTLFARLWGKLAFHFNPAIDGRVKRSE